MARRRRPRIVWADPALDELDDIATWIAADDPRAAGRLVRRVFARVERLRNQPRTGRYVPEAGTRSHREVIVGVLRVIYREDGTQILIVAVLGRGQLLRPWHLG
jgi:plasmid stabilization system protein ParE